MVPKSYGIKVPEGHVPNEEEFYYKYDPMTEKFKALGKCTGDAFEDYSYMVSGDANVPVWTFNFYGTIIKSHFSNELKKGNIYYKVSASK